jgi:hypothetical protein
MLGLGIWLVLQNDRLRQELAHLKSIQRESLPSERPVNTEQPLQPPPVFTFLLTPGVTKGAADRPHRLWTTPGLKDIRFELDLPGLSDDPLIRIDLYSAGSEHRHLVLSRAGLHSVPSVGGRTLLLSISPDQLPAGDYIAYLTSQLGEGSSQTLESYVFSVASR